MSDANDPRLEAVARRAAAAKLATWWTGDSATPRTGIKIDLPNGRLTRSIRVDAERAAKLADYAFEQWTVLGDYEAILDPQRQEITAVIDLRGNGSLREIPGIAVGPAEEEPAKPNPSPVWTSLKWPGKPLGPASLVLAAPSGTLSLEIRTEQPDQMAAAFNSIGARHLVIGGVSATRHDDALALLQDLSTSLFVDLDIGFAVCGALRRGAERASDEPFDEEPKGSHQPRFPIIQHHQDAALLYLYGRSLRDIPLLDPRSTAN